MDTNTLRNISALFNVGGTFLQAGEFGDGHINQTYEVTYLDKGKVKSYTLQRINKAVFKDSVKLMANMSSVTGFIKNAITNNGGDVSREVLNIIPTKTGLNYYIDDEGYCWRMCDTIKDIYSYSVAVNPEQMYETGRAFGRFIKLLGDFDADGLYETIEKFHDTRDRFRYFKEILREDKLGRSKYAMPEIEFALKYEDFVNTLVDLRQNGELPVRVTHNDTKINNVLMDKDTGCAVCVIDLDTVMPGLAAYDFGDAIRSGANPSDEDERDLSKVTMDLSLYEGFTKGYLSEAGGILTENELLSLPVGAKMMTLECGIRFLGDYLNGDTYFRIHREGHNLDRARTQFKMVSDMEKVWTEMNDIVIKYGRRT